MYSMDIPTVCCSSVYMHIFVYEFVLLTFLLENRLVLPDREKYDSSMEEEEPKAPLLKNIEFFSIVQK